MVFDNLFEVVTDEVAEDLGLHPRTVDYRLKKARDKLRGSLSQTSVAVILPGLDVESVSRLLTRAVAVDPALLELIGDHVPEQAGLGLVVSSLAVSEVRFVEDGPEHARGSAAARFRSESASPERRSSPGCHRRCCSSTGPDPRLPCLLLRSSEEALSRGPSRISYHVGVSSGSSGRAVERSSLSNARRSESPGLLTVRGCVDEDNSSSAGRRSVQNLSGGGDEPGSRKATRNRIATDASIPERGPPALQSRA